MGAIKRTRFAFIGGSGLSNLGENTTWENVDPKEWNTEMVSPEQVWGAPSAPLVMRNVHGFETVILARHGIGHVLSPHTIPFRANIAALKYQNVTDVISFCAVGSLDRQLEVGTFVLVEQYLDFTQRTNQTFFESEGLVAHVEFGKPTCERLSDLVMRAGARLQAELSTRPEASEQRFRICRGGTLACINGPQFSTAAESRAWKVLGANLVGMTTVTEAKLAREAEMCYCNIAVVTDYDSLPDTSSPVKNDGTEHGVTAQQVEGTLANVNAFASQLLDLIAREASGDATFASHPRGTCPCDHALDDAIVTEESIRTTLRQSLKYKKFFS